MRHVKMVAVEDSQYGGLGLKFQRDHKFCSGMFTAQNGLVVAHDIVEHQQGTAKIGSIGDEMVAFGGIIFTRAQWGEMNRNNPNSIFTPEEGLSFDVVNMAEIYFNENVPFRQKLVKTRDPHFGFIIDRVVELSRETMKKSTNFEKPLSQDQIDGYLADCQDYMLHGAKLAIRRFGCGMTANNLFWNIEQAAERYAPCLDYEGQTFRLSYDLDRATMEEVYPEEY